MARRLLYVCWCVRDGREGKEGRVKDIERLVRCMDIGMQVEEKKVIKNLTTRRTSMYIWTGGGGRGQWCALKADGGQVGVPSKATTGSRWPWREGFRFSRLSGAKHPIYPGRFPAKSFSGGTPRFALNPVPPPCKSWQLLERRNDTPIKIH